MRALHAGNGQRLVLLALYRLAQSERQHERVRAIKHRIIAYRVNMIAGEEDHPTTLDHKLVHALAYLRCERFDIAQHNDLVVTQALLFQAFPGYGLGIKQWPSQDTTRLQRMQQVKNFAVKQRGARVAIHQQHVHWRHRTQSIIEAIIFGKPVTFKADLPPMQTGRWRRNTKGHRHPFTGTQVNQLLADEV